jgi:hypothetical protein
MLYLVRLRLLILVVVCLIVTFATGIAIGVADQTPVPNLESTTLNAVQPVAPASLPIAGSTNALLGINPDVNNDGLTDIVDFMQMAAAFGKTPADADWDPALDLNSDGVIDINDFPLATTRWRRRPVFIVLTSPANSEGNVLLTRETIIEFSGPINPATATSSAVSAQSAGQPLTGQLRFSPAGKTVTLFYGEPLPLSTAVRVTIDSSHLIDADGYAVDADGDGLAGGVATINFNTRGPAPLASNGATLFASNLAGCATAKMDREASRDTISRGETHPTF